MRLLTSGFAPVHLGDSTLSETFYELIAGSDLVRLAVGFVTADSLMELQRLLESNLDRTLSIDLIIGMHYFEGFTRHQYDAAISLASFLRECDRGWVKVVTSFPYHGKFYMFSKDSRIFASIIGSSNLGSLSATHGIYETDLLLNDGGTHANLLRLFESLSTRASKPINEVENVRFVETRVQALENIKGVARVSKERLQTVRSNTTRIAFTIPIKTAEVAGNSNINACFGVGRKNTRTGLSRPRHWYEVELIVPQKIRQIRGYPPRGTEFTAITDDGWSFRCHVGGQSGKNLRSKDDLQILGRWIKGRLESHGCLKIGERVTFDTLERYGRRDFTLSATSEPDVWYIDFSVGESSTNV